MEWEVFFADGSTRDSRHDRWEDLPGGIIAVRYWDGDKKGINWGDSIYGHPATWKDGIVIAEETFKEILARAQASATPPSKR